MIRAIEFFILIFWMSNRIIITGLVLGEVKATYIIVNTASISEGVVMAKGQQLGV